jgi:hypothetical protein
MTQFGFESIEPSRELPRAVRHGIELKPGDRVRLLPREGADIFDLVLTGRTATITAIEQDYEDRIHLAVTVDDDPGRDLGEMGKIAHRFYFGIDEVEPEPSVEHRQPES